MRQVCSWVELTDNLRAHVCDGQVILWYDHDTHQAWLPSETPPPQWRQYMKRHHGQLDGVLGDAGSGMCPPHPAVKPRPAQKIVRLQKALNALARRVNDHALGVTVDGLVGGHTVKATNRAMYMYAKGGAPSEFTTGALTHSQVVSFAPQLAAYIERSPIAAATRAAPATSPSLPTPAPSSMPAAYAPPTPPSGGTMPAYYGPPPAYGPAPSYYPQQPYYYSNRAPGGLPPDQASVDVKAFIPAQYEHVRVDPTTVMAAIIVGVGIFIVMSKKKKES